MFPTLVGGDRLIVNKIGYTIGEPDYGEIVILSYSDSVEYVKRVIGKGGDTIEIKDMVVYRNGEPLSEAYINTEAYEDFSEVTVPVGTYFVMGDNRANSSDSRYPSLGFVERDAIDGKVIFRIWPLSEIGLV
jgi:signal peptidase I